MKQAVIFVAGWLAILTAEGAARATCSTAGCSGDCSDNRLVEVGRIPDVIFPAGRATCITIPPALLKVKPIADTSVGNCGLCVHVRTGTPHVGVKVGASTKNACIPSTFHPTNDPSELQSSRSVVELIDENNDGFTIYSDGTPGSGTIEVSSRDGLDFHNYCDPSTGPGPYAIGTFNYFVTSSPVTDTAFTHIVSAANTPVPSHTVITHPLLDGFYDARPILTSVWNYGSNPGVDDNHPVGLKFGIDFNGVWSIVALDGGALPMGAQFNIDVAPHSDTGQFVAPHVPAFRRSIIASSFLNHDSQALLFPVWGGNVQDGPSTVGSYYNAASGSWVLSNMSPIQMPDDSDYFVRFISSPGSFSSLAQRVVSDSSNTFGESLFLDNSFKLNAFSRVFVSPIWAPGPSQFAPDGPEVAAPLGLWWTGSQWAIWRQDWQAIPAGAAFNVYWHRPAIVAFPTRGDSNGDKYADIALVGGSGSLSTISVATSSGDGQTFNPPTSFSDSDFFSWTQVAKSISGDFDGDGRNDVALTGGSGWGTIPVAFSMGDGTFRVTNRGVSIDDLVHTPVPKTSPVPTPDRGDANFPSYAGQAAANPVGGDFNGDGLQDIALLTVPGQSTIPIAFSRGDGTFYGIRWGVTTGDPNFTSYATQGAKVVAGDFDGDGRSDIALTGGPGWATIPVAFSYGNGSFNATNTPVSSFPALAAQAQAQVVAGDFDGDGRDDIAVVGASCGVVVAFSNGDGSFRVAGPECSDFGNLYADYPGVKVFAGDFDGDGAADLGLIANETDYYGGTNHYQVIRISNGEAIFSSYLSIVTGPVAPDFISIAATSDAAVLSGSSARPYLRNLARGQAVSGTPAILGGELTRAVDGNPSGEWGGDSVTHTDYVSQPWWQVDLGATHYVASIDVFNRTDCCADRLTNFNVMTSTDGSSWSTQNVAGTGGTPSTLGIYAQARFVKIQLVGTNNLSLAEVYVWGT
jgi:hypothetical protein